MNQVVKNILYYLYWGNQIVFYFLLSLLFNFFFFFYLITYQNSEVNAKETVCIREVKLNQYAAHYFQVYKEVFYYNFLFWFLFLFSFLLILENLFSHLTTKNR